MSWIPSSSLFSVTFQHGSAPTRAVISGQNGTTMDVVPGRWQMDQVGFEHALVHFVARWIRAPHAATPFPHWSLTNHNGFAHYKDHAFQDIHFSTPDWGFEAGGVLFHQGSPVHDAHVVLRLETDGLRLPDGVLLPLAPMAAIAVESYSWESKLAFEQMQAVLAAVRAQPTEEHFQAQLLCFIAGYAQAAIDGHAQDFTKRFFYDLVSNTLPNVAAVALHGLKSHGRSGQDATKHLCEYAGQTTNTAHKAWLVRPNKALVPTRWVAGPLMDAVVDAIAEGLLPATLFEAGRACGALALEERFVPQILTTPALAKSAHDAIAHKAFAQRITSAALRALAASPHLLRPLTARKALAMASS